MTIPENIRRLYPRKGVQAPGWRGAGLASKESDKIPSVARTMRFSTRKNRSRSRSGAATLLVSALLVAIVGTFMPHNFAEAASCTLQGNTITVSCDFAPGTYYYNGTFTVSSGVTVTAGSSTSPGQVVIFADDFVIDGTISADGLGNAAGRGPGGGHSSAISAVDGEGGAYGGYGGRSSARDVNVHIYGSAVSPVDLGSGGGDDNGASGEQGGAGGGAIRMATYSSSTGTMSFGPLGTVTANGSNGQASFQGGGGSGGSIWLETGVLDVTDGFISANGGNGGTSTVVGGGGGSGGRIAISFRTTSGVFTQTRQAYGGARGTTQNMLAQVGAAGTIYARDLDEAGGSLTIDNNNQADSPFTRQAFGEDITAANLYVYGAAQYLIGATNTLTVSSGGTIAALTRPPQRSVLWISGTLNAPSEAMTLSGLDVHQSGTVGTLKYLNFENGIYSLETATALFSAGRGQRLEGLTVSGTSGYTIFSASSTGILYIDTLTVKSGAVVTHASNTTTTAGIQHQLSVSATTSITVESGGSIDVSKKGYNVSEGPGQGGDASIAPAGGGAYGGDGGRPFISGSTVLGGTGYGSITQPADLGSGGGNDTVNTSDRGRGGGIIKLAAGGGSGTITINGTLAAEGGDAQQATIDRDGGGAGGSVWIDVPSGTVAGSGTVSVDGGDGYNQSTTSSSGGGGGGRIAIYYSGSHSLTLNAKGGAKGNVSATNGGAGSIYEKAAADTNGVLTFDNRNAAGDSTFSRLVSPSSLSVKTLSIRNDAHFLVPSGTTLTVEPTTGTITSTASGIDNQPSLWIVGTFNYPNEAMTVAALNVHQTGTAGVLRYLNVDNGIYSLDTSSALFSAGRGNRLETLTVSGTSGWSIFSASSTGIFYVDVLTVKSGGTVTSASNTTTALGVRHRLHVSATTSVDIQSGGSIDVTGKGYQAGQGPGTGGAGFTAGGGAHGGNGGRQNTTPIAGGNAYDSATSPVDVGSGGGAGTAGTGGEGGGGVRIVAPTLNVSGSIVANGATNNGSNNGGGAGGSILLEITTLTGAGSITANGGSGGTSPGGGGGRIAIYTTTDSSTLTRQAFGGVPTSSTHDAGGAGTIYLKDDAAPNGDLIVTNSVLDDAYTPQIDTTQTYDNLTISRGARYFIGTGKTLSVASGGTFTTGGGKQPTLFIDGTFNPPNATQTITAIDIHHNGTIGTTTSLTYSNGRYNIYTKGALFSAGAGNRLGSLTLGAGATMSATSDAIFYVDTLTMNSGSVFTSATNTTARQHTVEISATTSITVNSGASIDVDGLGYIYKMGPGAGATNNTGGGGAHGGDGGAGYSGLPNPGAGGSAYDSITQPYEMGSGGGDSTATSAVGVSGGGYVSLRVNSGGTITVNGTITADGQSDPGSGLDGGGGAGGGIFISSATGTVTGTGTISAEGGSSDNLTSSGGGGGGRIAVYYSGTAPSFTYDVSGGTGSNGGGAGTVYTKAAAQTHGSLLVDNGNLDRPAYTPQTASNTSITFDAITIRKGGRYRVPAGHTLAMASAGNCDALAGGGPLLGSLTIDGTFTGANATCTLSGVDIHHNGSVGTITALTVAGGARYSFYTPGALFTAGPGNRLTTLVVNGATFSTSGTALFHVNTLTVQSGGVLTHASNTGEKRDVLDVSATSSITIDSGGRVDVDGKGYVAQNGPGAGTTASRGTGGGHGGEGGNSNAPTTAVGGTYDSIIAPLELGSGGGDSTSISGIGGGPGGGTVRLAVNSGGTVTVNGIIDADGQDITTDGGAGAGGSVWINAPGATVVGSGTITANGGNTTAASEGGGGGGRIAVYYGGSAPSLTYQARGGQGGNSTAVDAGGAGTVFTKSDAQSNGSLTVDNNSRGGNFTTQSASDTSVTFDAITISGAGYYRIPAGRTLSLASAGSCSGLSGGGTNRGSLTIDGTFNTANATCTMNGVDITQRATIGVATSLTFTNSRYTVSASGSLWTAGPGNRLNTLIIGSSATLVATTTAPIYLDTLTIQSGGNATHEENFSDLKNYLYISATTSVTVNSGGTIDVIGKGFAAAQGPGRGANGGTSGGGGGYGGNGGSASSGAAGGTAYGNFETPFDLGSGGGDNTGTGGQQAAAGGGFIRIVTSQSGSVTFNGVVSASGTSATGTGGGGGSGGSIWIDTGTFTQTAATTASGGAGQGTTGGCGGGGRIAIHYLSLTTSSTTTAASGCTGARAGQTGSVFLNQSGEAPDVGPIVISPSNPEVGHNIHVSATATDDVGIQTMEIYLDGTAAGNLRKTCSFSPTQNPASCDTFLGSLAAGSHTVYVKAYDNFSTATTESQAFTVADRTGDNSLVLSRLKVGASASVTLTFSLNATSTGTLTLTFPAGFTVTSAATSGSSCLSAFGFTSTTMTATKTNCAGTVTMSGGTVTNPATAGQYTVVWSNDNGSSVVTIVADDQFTISATVDPTLTFNVGAQTAACDGTFAGSGGTLSLGTLTTSAVATSDVNSVPHVCMRLTTNATAGAVVTVASRNAALKSTGTPADTIPSSTATLTAGTSGYGICAGSGGGDSGRDSTAPAGAAPVRIAPFAGSCSTSAHDVGGLTVAPRQLWQVTGPSQNAFFRIYVKAAISSGAVPHDDYSDVLTFIATGTY